MAPVGRRSTVTAIMRSSPYSLNCKKNSASYDRRVVQRRRDLADIAALKRTEGAGTSQSAAGHQRGSPEQVIDGRRYFGYVPRRRHGQTTYGGPAPDAARRGLRPAEPAGRVFCALSVFSHSCRPLVPAVPQKDRREVIYSITVHASPLYRVGPRESHLEAGCSVVLAGFERQPSAPMGIMDVRPKLAQGPSHGGRRIVGGRRLAPPPTD
jgi:hypothetical protein